jgi:CDP-glucose 4,6-dehydratase
LSQYRNKKVFITGHNGFKGSWMCKVLTDLGAKVCGYSIPAKDDTIAYMREGVESIEGDVRSLKDMKEAISSFSPDIAIHMAAQPLVREAYLDPAYTYEVNVMGTVNFMEALRFSNVRSIVNVTTDKVYRNLEQDAGYREDDIIDGNDPYANSKSCSELVTSTYRRAFFDLLKIPVSTCRAGNVIGGGDWAKDRIVPDCVKAAMNNETIKIRNPASIRPYQHVLEPVCAYLMVAMSQMNDRSLSGSYNIGPVDGDYATTLELVKLFAKNWKDAKWESVKEKDAPKESGILKLDSGKMKRVFNWTPKWNTSDAVSKTVEWYRAHADGKDMGSVTKDQIREYLS